MAFLTVFKRRELKYIITREEKERILRGIEQYMKPDRYGRTTVRNVYFDTDNYRLIRRSIEKPIYKEKLRIRSYCRASDDSVVFVELKRKYDGVVYKRRMATDNAHAMKWCSGGEFISSDDQIEREIDYFIRFYQGLRPTVFLSYDREAYHGIYDEGFRLTFDENILARTNELSLTQPPYGEPLLNAAEVLMELKCAGGIPLFMVDILSSEKIYKTSFSKYGAAYRKLIFGGKCK
ncbi:MAG: polyphosphate polymerase domain-containing protein [Clostridia bacterium]|nr:polyphosphate polymerase domain-containing protein [Clostridia bacterium]